jgi:hypothetical protein
MLSRWLFAFALGFHLCRRHSKRALEGARAGATAVAASGLLLVSALAFIAMRYRVDGRPTPWFAAVFVGMLVFTCLTAVVGFLAGGAGGALGQRRNTAT